MIISIVSPIIQGVYEGYNLSPIYTGSFYCFRMSLIHIFSFYLFMCLFGYLLIDLFLFILYCLDSQRMDGPSSSHTRQVRILGIFPKILEDFFVCFVFFLYQTVLLNLPTILLVKLHRMAGLFGSVPFFSQTLLQFYLLFSSRNC